MAVEAIIPPSSRIRRFPSVGPNDARSALGVFLVLLLVRTFTDSSVLPESISYFLNLGIAAAAVVIGLGFTLVGRSGRGSDVLALLALTTAGFGMLAVVLFSVQLSIVAEYLRFTSILAMAVLMRTALQGGIAPAVLVRRALAVATPAVVLIVLGYLGQFAFLVNQANGRVAGTFNQRNGAAGFVAVFLVGALWVAIRTRRPTPWAQAAVGFVALVGTLSLGGMTAAAAGGIVLLLFSLPRLPVFGRVLLVSAFVVGAYLLSTNDEVAGRLDQLNGNVSFDASVTANQSTNSLQWRIVNWRLLLQIWAQRPTFGWGFGSTTSIVQPLGTLPHNEYVRILVETGVVGAAIALGVIVFGVVRLLRSGPQERSAALHVLGLSIIATALTDAVVSNTISYPPMMYLLAGFLTAAMGVRVPRGSSAAPGPSTVELPGRRLP